MGCASQDRACTTSARYSCNVCLGENFQGCGHPRPLPIQRDGFGTHDVLRAIIPQCKYDTRYYFTSVIDQWRRVRPSRSFTNANSPADAGDNSRSRSRTMPMSRDTRGRVSGRDTSVRSFAGGRAPSGTMVNPTPLRTKLYSVACVEWTCSSANTRFPIRPQLPCDRHGCRRIRRQSVRRRIPGARRTNERMTHG